MDPLLCHMCRTEMNVVTVITEPATINTDPETHCPKREVGTCSRARAAAGGYRRNDGERVGGSLSGRHAGPSRLVPGGTHARCRVQGHGDSVLPDRAVRLSYAPAWTRELNLCMLADMARSTGLRKNGADLIAPFLYDYHWVAPVTARPVVTAQVILVQVHPGQGVRLCNFGGWDDDFKCANDPGCSLVLCNCYLPA